MKIIGKALALVLFFVGGWLLLGQVNYLEWWGISAVTKNSEEKISEFIKENIERTEDVIKDKEIVQKIDSLLKRIMDSNNMDEDVKLIILDKEAINAFALPTDYLIINSGLIQACESAEALSGVMAHELGHIRLNHVRKKIIKELGVSVLVSSTSGSGGEVARQITKTLSSSAYDRSLEEEADEKAVEYLIKAHINPEPLATFFYLLSTKEPEFISDFEWLSTHPTSEKRAEQIIELMNANGQNKAYNDALSVESWTTLKADLKARSEESLFEK